MSDPIKLKITRAGLEAALSADIAGISIRLDKVKFSTATFVSVVNDSRTTLPNVVAESSIAAGGTSTAQNTLRCFTVVNSASQLSIGSVGLFTNTGVLFAIASVEKGELLKILPKISFVMSFGVTLAAEILNNVQVVVDSAASLAAALIFQHEKHANPHPQYRADLTDHQAQIDAIVGYTDELNKRLTSLQQGTSGNVASREFQFTNRTFDQYSTIYPLFYRANGRTSGVAVSYHLLGASVEMRPNAILEQTLQYVTYTLDSLHRIYLPIAIPPGDILSIHTTAESLIEINDMATRVHSVYQERVGSKLMTVIQLMIDRVNEKSTYNGQTRGYITVKGRGNYTQLQALNAVYPQSNYY